MGSQSHLQTRASASSGQIGGSWTSHFPKFLAASCRPARASHPPLRRGIADALQPGSKPGASAVKSNSCLNWSCQSPTNFPRERDAPAASPPAWWKKSLELGCPCQATAWPHRMIAAVEALELSKTSGAASLGRQRRKRWLPQCVTSSYECCDDMSQFGKFDVPRS